MRNEIADWLISKLKADTALSSATIMLAGDESVDRTARMIVVDVVDKGNHLGIPGRILVDGSYGVALYENTTDDPSGSGSLSNALASALGALPWGDEHTEHWYIRYIAGYSQTASVMDGAYRRTNFAADFFVQDINI